VGDFGSKETQKPAGYVYFAAATELGMVKIGWSGKSPDSRMRMHQIGCPVPLERLGYVRGNRDAESRIHDLFSREHSDGEWFYLSARLRAWIEANCEAWPDPPRRKERDRAMERVVRESEGNPQLSPQALAARKVRYERLDKEYLIASVTTDELTRAATEKQRARIAADQLAADKDPTP
jgi:hypothetical protein